MLSGIWLYFTSFQEESQNFYGQNEQVSRYRVTLVAPLLNFEGGRYISISYCNSTKKNSLLHSKTYGYPNFKVFPKIENVQSGQNKLKTYGIEHFFKIHKEEHTW